MKEIHHAYRIIGLIIAAIAFSFSAYFTYDINKSANTNYEITYHIPSNALEREVSALKFQHTPVINKEIVVLMITASMLLFIWCINGIKFTKLSIGGNTIDTPNLTELASKIVDKIPDTNPPAAPFVASGELNDFFSKIVPDGFLFDSRSRQYRIYRPDQMTSGILDMILKRCNEKEPEKLKNVSLDKLLLVISPSSNPEAMTILFKNKCVHYNYKKNVDNSAEIKFEVT